MSWDEALDWHLQEKMKTRCRRFAQWVKTRCRKFLCSRKHDWEFKGGHWVPTLEKKAAVTFRRCRRFGCGVNQELLHDHVLGITEVNKEWRQ